MEFLGVRGVHMIQKLFLNIDSNIMPSEIQITAVQLIAFNSQAHLVSKAGSVIGAKSPSPAFKWSGS